ncbi:NPCBM/NEW2 domain-containing protein [Paracerasibacillus soli]|uniref:NPCBM/NEW2 domain-containing protein n=1 Tax=Paracerasibacillus soli TaxID=480284 RepID=A0ABU5CUP7_9BACI|nr:NPCBM/NEW2 domain-containing protein [Virgibacillus soli]MDY0410091.1 NPCBM/NEW2 domain-containing protein [Virgibacillus soli]
MKPISFPGNDDWAYYHEWGHNINNSIMEHGEVTNNLYAVIMRKKMNNNYDDRADWDSLYRRFQGEEVNHGFFTYLGVLLQIQYYYGEDSYGKASRVARTNPDGIMDGLDNHLQRLVIGFSVATKTDLTTFFDDWGYVKATEKMKEKVAHLPKPDVKLEYMHSLGRDYNGTGFSKDAKLTINTIKVDTENKQNTITFGIDKTNRDAAMGYEISRDGKVIGYTTSTSFVDDDIDPSKSYLYEVVAYDKKLNSIQPEKANSKKPNLSVEEFVTLKLRQDYDPMDYVKASSYLGDDITQDVTVKSNNIDITKRGNYKVVYEVNNGGIKETKTANVTVTSDYTYLSDINEKSAEIEWGSLKKDLSPAGGAITLIRQGIDVTYPKGIGAHANSEVVYDVQGVGYDFFESYIGIDQAVKGQPSSATFEVWIDGKREFTSGVFKSDTEHEFIRVPVTGAKEIKLVTTDANQNGIASDHTVWAEAKFTLESSKPKLTIPPSVATKVGVPIDLDDTYEAKDPEDGDLTDAVKVTGIEKVNFDVPGKYEIIYSVTDSDGNKASKKRIVSVVDMDNFTYLSDYDWIHTENNYAGPNKDVSISSNPLRLTDKDGNEVAYKKGIGAHANSTIVYDLTEIKAAYLSSYVGVDRQMYGTIGSVVFQVYVDGLKKFDSGLMNSKDPQKYFEVDISGGKELKIVVTDGGNGNGSDHATWEIPNYILLVKSKLPQW